jgi:glutamate 5-kinase
MASTSTRESSESVLRDHLSTARRVVVKVGSSSLASTETGLDVDHLDDIVRVLAERQHRGSEIVLVSSGAIAAGLEPLGMSSRPTDIAQQQAAASVGQSQLMAAYNQAFAQYGLHTAQVLLTKEDLSRKTSFDNALQTFGALTRLGVIPIVNENDTVATREIRMGDNDFLAALVAELVRADALILLSDVDGLYTQHPSHPSAEFISYVGEFDELVVDALTPGSSGVGSGGMATKLEAARLATSAGIPVGFARWDQAKELLAGENVGTVFAAADKRLSRRHGWLAHASEAQGSITVDAGAERALCEAGASLLAAGITAVDGDFAAGDSVEILGLDGHLLARGAAGFDADVLRKMLGHTSAEILASLGAHYTKPVIHRDDMVMIAPCCSLNP